MYCVYPVRFSDRPKSCVGYGNGNALNVQFCHSFTPSQFNLLLDIRWPNICFLTGQSLIIAMFQETVIVEYKELMELVLKQVSLKQEPVKAVGGYWF